MSEATALSARLIGEIFVERGLVTQEQLEEALRVQEGTGEILGEILVGRFGVSRIELASVLAEQWSALERQAGRRPGLTPVPSPAPVADAGATAVDDDGDEESRRPIGSIFVERGMVSEEQLTEALEVQRETGERLGEILVRLGAIGRLDLAGALAEQWAGLQKLRPPAPRAPEPWQEAAVRSVETPVGNAAPAEADLREAVAALQTQVTALASRPDPDLTVVRAEARALAERLDDHDGRLGALSELEELRAQLDGVQRALATLDERVAEQDAGREQLSPRLEALRERLDGVAAGVEELRAATPGDHGVDELRASLDALRERLDELVTEIAAARETAVDGHEVAELRQALDEVERRLDGLDVAGLGHALELLDGRIQELQARVDARDPHTAELEALRTGVDEVLATVSARLDELESLPRLPQVNAEAFAEVTACVERLEGRTGELAAALDAGLASARDAVDELRRAVAEGEDGRVQEALAELTRRVQVLDRGDEVERLQERLVALEAGAGEVARPEELEALSVEMRERIDALRSTLEAAQERSSPRAELIWELQNRVGELEGRLAGAPTRGEISEQVADLAARIADVRVLVAEGGREEQLAELERSLAGLGERVDGALEAERRERAEELGARLAELRRELDGVREAVAGTVSADEVAELRGRAETLEAHLAGKVDRAQLEDLGADLSRRVEERLGEVARRPELEELRERVVLLRAEVDEQRLAADVDGRLAALRDELDGVREAVAGTVSADEVAELRSRLDGLSGAVPAELVAEVQERVDALDVRLGEVARRPELEELRERVVLLRAEVDEQRLAADVDGRLAALRDELDGVREAVAGTVSADEVAELRGRAETLEAHLAAKVDRAQLEDLGADLSRRVEAVQEAVDASRLDARLDALEEALSGLGERAADSATRPELAAAVGDLRAQLDELRPLLERGGADPRVESLESTLRGLRERLEAAPGRDELAALGDELRARIGELRAALEDARLESRVAGLESALGGLGERVHDAVARAEVDALAGELHGRMDELHGRLDASRTDARLEEVASSLDGLRERLDGSALAERLEAVEASLPALRERADDAAGKDDLEALAGDLRRRVDELRDRQEAVAGLEGRASLLEAHVTDLAAGVQEAVSHTDGLRAELAAQAEDAEARVADLAGRVHAVDAALADAVGRLQAALADRASGADLERLGEELVTGLVGVHERFETTRADLLEGLEARVRPVEDRLDGLVDRHALEALSAELHARADAAAAAGAEASATLAAGLDAVAIELREGLATLHRRVDDLAAGLGHTDGRLAALEGSAGDRSMLEELGAALSTLRADVDRETALGEERARATERALRKGLAGLGERLVAGEQAYLEAGAALRRSVERLGAAVVEADVRLAEEGLDPAVAGHVAFVPSADGYRLQALAGPAPEVGAVVQLAADEPALRVVRSTTSPLPLDRRRCVYLESV